MTTILRFYKSLMLFFKNIRFLFKNSLKSLNKEASKELKRINGFELDCMRMVDNIIYELPDRLHLISKPKIKNFSETLDNLVSSNSSIIRFGDGEIILIKGGDIGFQSNSEVLKLRLKEILQSNESNILIGINYHYYYADLRDFNEYPKYVYRTFVSDIRNYLSTIINFDTQYYSAGITSPYQMFKNYDFEQHYDKLMSLWRDRDVAIICGDKSFENISYNIFDCASSIEYQYCPFSNAFTNYDDIFNRACGINKSKLIIAILGPTAKLLAFDLSKEGYRVLDMGHLAKDFDDYKKQSIKNKQTIGKFFEN